LPKGWTDDPARLKTTYVPDDVSFSTKPPGLASTFAVSRLRGSGADPSV
jgi:hypothetical protein